VTQRLRMLLRAAQAPSAYQRPDRCWTPTCNDHDLYKAVLETLPQLLEIADAAEEWARAWEITHGKTWFFPLTEEQLAIAQRCEVAERALHDAVRRPLAAA
jgi:hypothetical protein